MNGQSGTGQFLIVGQIALAHPHFGRFVGAGALQNLHSLPIIGKGDFHRIFVDIVAQRGADFLGDVFAAVGGSVLVGAAAVLLAADGNIAIEVGGAVCIGFRAGGHQLTGGKNKAAVCIVNIIGGVQVKHGTGKIFAGFAVDLIHAHTGLFAVIIELEGLLLGKRGICIFAANHRENLFKSIIARLGNALCHDHIVQLVVPCKGNIVAVRSAHIAIRRLGFRNVIAAQRQGHADLTDGAVVDDRQEIIGGRRARGGKHGSVSSAVTGRNHRHHIALGVPESSVAVVIQLAILRVDVLGCRDGVLGTCQRASFVGEIAVLRFAGHPRVNAVRLRLPASQHLAGLADGQLAEGFVVGILFTDHKGVHAVFVLVAGRLINAVGGNDKINIVTFIGSPRIVIAVGRGGFHNAILAQR